MNRKTRRLTKLGLLMLIFAFTACHNSETQEPEYMSADHFPDRVR